MAGWTKMRTLAPSLVAGALWLVSGGLFAYLTWFSIARSPFVMQVLPQTIPDEVWRWPSPWPVVLPIASVATVIVVHQLLTRRIRKFETAPGVSVFLASWFAVILTAFAATVPFALAQVVSSFPPQRAAFILDPIGDGLMSSVYWGLLFGWIPALVERSSYAHRAQEAPKAYGPPRRSTAAVLAGVAALALVVCAVGYGFGSRSARLQVAAEAAIADGQTVGAYPDPDVEVTPPPTRSTETAAVQPEWCTPDDATLLLGERDAATGHRTLSIRASNYSAESCVLDGYPDLAFADQNGSGLDVTLTHDGSFMTDDAGAAPVTIPAGGYAITRLGWNANATAGQLVTSTLYAAMYPGLDRGSWPITLDITAGSEVAVTAWELTDSGQDPAG